ncbi:unnamed protein product [Nezara viridula]|uniref:Uncharacterized protein n=1 Tax=Nezara viridula TaxID=85310 RepID=A0A9P0EIG0_NEZVI|nr:unnamed protein product [Nezara viridula]
MAPQKSRLGICFPSGVQLESVDNPASWRLCLWMKVFVSPNNSFAHPLIRVTSRILLRHRIRPLDFSSWRSLKGRRAKTAMTLTSAGEPLAADLHLPNPHRYSHTRWDILTSLGLM